MNDKPLTCNTLILGGGLTGLWAASACVKAGRYPLVIESSPVTGGLARTIEREGRKFDIGGHRVYFSDRKLLDELIDLSGRKDMLFLDRRSSILSGGKLLRYPPTVSDGAKMGMKTVRTLLASAFRKKAEVRTLRDWVVARFGQEIHDIYFRDYSEKVWGLPTDKISALWADKRIGNFDAIDLLRQAISRCRPSAKENVTEFAYPRKGIGSVCAALEKQLAGKGEVWTGAEPVAFEREGDRLVSLRFRHNGEEKTVTFTHAISTIPMASFLPLVGRGDDAASLAAGLKYRSVALVCLAIEAPKFTDDHWIYVPDKGIIFSRITEFSNWGLEPNIPGERRLSCEIFCDEGDPLWSLPDSELVARTLADLRKLVPFPDSAVKLAFVERVRHGYPVSYLGYEQALARATEYLSFYTNLRLAGRQGQHMYYDMEECIASALAAVGEG